MKNVLVIHYSQSGQLSEIAATIAAPLVECPEIQVDFHQIKPEKPFPFPWTKATFFDAFPESFLQEPVALQSVPEKILNTNYDLVLLAYQVWFLSPSIPVNSFLKSPQSKILLQDTPVVTIIGCRNMWALAQEKVKRLLQDTGAKLKGNIVLIDKAGNLVSVITIVDWMFSGIKKKYLGIFPLPGVSDKDILESSRFGKTILTTLLQEDLDSLQPKLVAQDAVYVSPYLVSVDRKGNMIFDKWSAFIKKRKNTRAGWLNVFYVYLFLAIWIISPIVYILHILITPLVYRKRKKEVKYYQGV